MFLILSCKMNAKFSFVVLWVSGLNLVLITYFEGFTTLSLVFLLLNTSADSTSEKSFKKVRILLTEFGIFFSLIITKLYHRLGCEKGWGLHRFVHAITLALR